MKKGWMIIRAERVEGGWIMVGVSGHQTRELPQEGYVHATKKSVYTDAELMYPRNSVWQGHWGRGAYRIFVG